eukprot:TRINITY_DN7245_c0_g1_i1.p1 TRINITY_DN7245_c0_g1~~TRINITY_DN7245_c0_g1_i1.p1  ORF type:complete len:747 (+),score=212.76 TRINITY_DN7245_c0_g1_i1:53-2293(+)
MMRVLSALAALLPAALADVYTPNYQACTSTESQKLPFCNSSLSIDSRLDDLLSRLTLDEKINMIAPQPLLGSTCNDHTKGVERLGVPQYMWLTETNTGVNSACLGQNKCTTTFPGPLGLGSAFNRTLWRAKGTVMGTEMRAFTNAHWHRDAGSASKALIGITGYGPNINILRDPRFGRSSELPGEDPFLSGHYASEMVQGMQEKDAKGHLKMVAYLKHFTAYSKEGDRGHDSYNISMYDFWDTYLPQYAIAMTEGGASGVMCSYDAENGSPSCANGWLLNKVLRGWSKDAFVSTDCGAVRNLRGAPVNAPSDEHAAAFALNNGTDIEMGSTLFTTALKGAVRSGLTTEATVTAAVRRAMLHLFKAGRFDRPEEIEWSTIGTDVVNSSAHQAVAREAAQQSLVLLKNGGALPIRPGSKVAVVGPLGVQREGLLSDYYGDDVCYTSSCSGKNCFDCIPTIAEAVARANSGGSTTSASGVDVDSDRTSGIPQALALAKAADVVIAVVGNNKSVEHEGVDRTDTALLGQQEPFVQQLIATGKPVVLVLVNGGQLAIDNLVAGPAAIVEAFNPNVVGAVGVADALFGANRWGKLPYTMYPHDYIQQQDMSNYDMSKPPGRTYKYYTGEPLFPFGHGLSYTNFTHSCSAVSGGYECSVTNSGAVGGDEVVMVFHSVSDDIKRQAQHPVPTRALVGFDRVSVAAGATQTVTFSLGQDALKLVNAAGDRVLYKGQHTLTFSRGNGQDVAVTVTV